ncbi:MAG TPA: EamA family transporter RarD [Methylomirabilota bacterium]
MNRAAGSARTRGFVYGLGAYAIWGLIPVYFKAVASTPALEVLAHRIVWAFLMLLAVGLRQDGLRELRTALRSHRARTLLLGTTTLIAVNWLIYIWAVFHDRMVEASLGYFITPLVNVLLGVLVLKEQLERPVQRALFLAAFAVLWLTVLSGHVPWISLGLATSFGGYGLLRKLVPVGAVAGLTVETLLLAPFALAYIALSHDRGTLAFGSSSPIRDLLLVAAGPITAIPLLMFAGAVRRLTLTSLGFLQYLAPSLQFLLAVLVYREPFGGAQAFAFGLIWTALALFAAHTLRRGAAEPVMEPE